MVPLKAHAGVDALPEVVHHPLWRVCEQGVVLLPAPQRQHSVHSPNLCRIRLVTGQGSLLYMLDMSSEL